MGEFDGEWLFAVWMWIVVLMLIVMGIRDYRARRHLPKNSGDKRANRRIALDNLNFSLELRKGMMVIIRWNIGQKEIMIRFADKVFYTRFL